MYLKFLIAATMSLVFSTSAVAPPPVAAQVWTSTSDSQLRQDVELLKSYGIIDGPVNTWPLSWKQITRSIHDINTNEAPHPAHVMRAIARTLRKSPKNDWRISTDVRFTNEPKLVRGFGDTARGDADTSLSLGYQNTNIDAQVSVNYRNDQNGDDVNLDGSYIAANFNNWSLYAGSIERWWGPGQDNTLLLSTNARPMSAIGLRRNEPKPFETKWLSWIGPWTWDMFLAHMGKERHIPNALMVGMRLSLEPLKNFEVGLSRTMQLCGDNRPCDFKTWSKAIIAVGDLDNTGTLNEPGNQLASIDLAYSKRLGDKALRLYISGTAEDQTIFMPFQYARLLGATLSSPVGDKGDTLTINTEWSDSGNVLAWFFGQRIRGVIYGHRIYITGHRFDGRTLGHSLDNDSKLISFTTTYDREDGSTYSLSLRSATINWDNNNKNIISLSPTKYKSVEAKASNQFDFGRLELSITLQTKIHTLTQGKLPLLSAGIVWQKDF